jgi:chromate transport protein ChrA
VATGRTRGASIASIALTAVCAIAVLVPAVAESAHDANRLLLGAALVTAGIVLAGMGRLARSARTRAGRT